MNQLIPTLRGSYDPSDVVFLLKDLNDVALEQGTEDREEAIQSGVHYSEMLPVEYRPSQPYIDLFHATLAETAEKVAHAVAVVSEWMLRKRGRQICLVSLVRAGTPVGVLMKRYLHTVHQLEVPHYSVSIIRGKGIDENALRYIIRVHGAETFLQFVDGWTGKGAIRKQLIEAVERFRTDYGIELSDELAVLADPGHCAPIFGTREDFLIPSSCLNSTVSGLVSRSVHRSDLIGPDDFHGAKSYLEWLGEDLSNYYVERIEEHFLQVSSDAALQAALWSASTVDESWSGWADVRTIQERYGIADVNLVKPGVGETTRVLLRRIPWKILVDSLDNPNLKHIFLLAAERNVPIEVFEGLSYSCCGLIKPLSIGGAT